MPSKTEAKAKNLTTSLHSVETDILLLNMNKTKALTNYKETGFKETIPWLCGGSQRKEGVEFEVLWNYHHKGPTKVTVRRRQRGLKLSQEKTRKTQQQQRQKGKFSNQVIFNLSAGTTECVDFVCRSLDWDTLYLQPWPLGSEATDEAADWCGSVDVSPQRERRVGW